jgi:hypothetical protein
VPIEICGMGGVEGNYMQGFGGETIRKENICKTLALMGR